MSTLRTPRVPLCEDILIQTLHSPETWQPTITVPSQPDHVIPNPHAHLPPVIPHPHFLARPNQPPVFTDRLILPQDRGVTHRHIQTPTSHSIDFDAFFSSSPADVIDLLTATASPPPAIPSAPGTPMDSATITPSPPVSPSIIANLPTDTSFPYSVSD